MPVASTIANSKFYEISTKRFTSMQLNRALNKLFFQLNKFKSVAETVTSMIQKQGKNESPGSGNG